MRTMAAGKFKAQCLGVIDEVQAKREPVIVTKHGRAVAKVVPMDIEDDPLDIFRFPGRIEILGDIVAPIYTDAELEQFFEGSCEPFK